MQLDFWIIIALFLGLICPVYAEEYYYHPDFKLVQPPEFCAIEFNDPQLPQAEKILYEEMEKAVNEWKIKLQDYTKNTKGWDFAFSIISEDEHNNIFSEYECDVAIFFERESPEDYLGYADTFLFFSDITIFYLTPIYGDTIFEEEIDGEIIKFLDIEGFENSVDPFVGETLRHEIGHSLGLDHYPITKQEIDSHLARGEQPPSIMVKTRFYPENVSFDITDYDIRAVANLYGEEGITVPEYWAYLEYVIIIIIIIIIALILHRRKRKSKN